MKKFLHFGFLLGLIFIFHGCSSKYKTVNWYPTFDSKDKIPFGTYICENQLPYLFSESPIHAVSYNTEEFLMEGKMRRSNFIFIYPNINLNAALHYALEKDKERSNVFFLSAYEFNNSDKYNFSVSEEVERTDYPPKKDTIKTVERAEDSLLMRDSSSMMGKLYYSMDYYRSIAKNQEMAQFSFSDKLYNGNIFPVQGCTNRKYFSQLPNNADVLGYVLINGVVQPNFIRIPYNTHWLYLHLEPMVFTNYSMKNSKNRKYVAALFSHLPDKIIYWNNERIMGRLVQEKSDGGINSFLSFVLKKPSLKMGLMILVLSGLLYILFNSSRRQKAIPYFPPLKNDILNYSSSLTDLFKKTQNYKYLCTIKIQYFRNMLSDNFGIQKIHFDKEFAEKLHQYSKIDLKECQYLIMYIEKINVQGYCSSSNFTELSTLLNQFYLKTQWYGKSRNQS